MAPALLGKPQLLLAGRRAAPAVRAASAYLRVTGQECLYNVWSRLGREHLGATTAGRSRKSLEEGQFRGLSPFGPTLSDSLERARFDPETAEAVWEEEDYCTPPLAQERAAVLDRYFRDLRVEPVTQGAGWSRIEALPSLWDLSASEPDPAGEN